MFDDKVVISGVGQSEYGRRLLDRSGLSLAVEACLGAIRDAGLTPADIDGVATYPGADNSDPGFAGAGCTELMDAMGLHVNWWLGAAETTAQLGPVIAAAMAVASGMARHVVVFRALKEGSAQVGTGRAGVIPGGSHGRTDTARHWSEWFAPFGAVSPVNLNAMAAQRRMHDFGLTREQLGQIAVTSRANAARNPKAIYREPMTIDDYLAVRMISSPLSLYDCDVPIDGATAVVVSCADASPDLRRPALRLVSAGGAVHGRYSFDQSEDLTLNAAHASAEQMWRHTDLKPADVDVAELYDGFSVLTLSWIEALGFCGLGEGGSFIEGGERIAFDGELPINTQGGQLSGGRLHGLGFLHEACLQLWGAAGPRQLPTQPEVAVVSNGGGPFCGCLLLTASR